MELIYYLSVAFVFFAVLLIGYLLGYKHKSADFEKMRLDLCDAYLEQKELDERLKRIKKSWYENTREKIEIENALKQLRAENARLEGMYDYMKAANLKISRESYDAGDEIGYKRAWKEVGEIIIKESIVLNEGSIVRDKVPNQLINVK